MILILLLMSYVIERVSQASLNVDRNDWDILMLLKQKYKIGLQISDSDFMLNLTNTDHSFHIPAQTIFSNRIFPESLFIYMKFHPKVKSFTLLSIRDPNEKIRFQIRGFERRGQFNEFRLNIMMFPSTEIADSAFSDTVEFTIPFLYSSWTVGILIEHGKLTFFTNCDDIDKPLGYHHIVGTAPLNKDMFEPGATLYMFSDGTQDKFMGTVSEFIISNNERIKELMCSDEPIEGSGGKVTFWKLKMLGNILLTTNATTTTPQTTHSTKLSTLKTKASVKASSLTSTTTDPRISNIQGNPSMMTTTRDDGNGNMSISSTEVQNNITTNAASNTTAPVTTSHKPANPISTNSTTSQPSNTAVLNPESNPITNPTTQSISSDTSINQSQNPTTPISSNASDFNQPSNSTSTNIATSKSSNTSVLNKPPNPSPTDSTTSKSSNKSVHNQPPNAILTNTTTSMPSNTSVSNLPSNQIPFNTTFRLAKTPPHPSVNASTQPTKINEFTTETLSSTEIRLNLTNKIDSTNATTPIHYKKATDQSSYNNTILSMEIPTTNESHKDPTNKTSSFKELPTDTATSGSSTVSSTANLTTSNFTTLLSHIPPNTSTAAYPPVKYSGSPSADAKSIESTSLTQPDSTKSPKISSFSKIENSISETLNHSSDINIDTNTTGTFINGPRTSDSKTPSSFITAASQNKTTGIAGMKSEEPYPTTIGVMKVSRSATNSPTPASETLKMDPSPNSTATTLTNASTIKNENISASNAIPNVTTTTKGFDKASKVPSGTNQSATPPANMTNTSSETDSKKSKSDDAAASTTTPHSKNELNNSSSKIPNINEGSSAQTSIETATLLTAPIPIISNSSTKETQTSTSQVISGLTNTTTQGTSTNINAEGSAFITLASKLTTPPTVPTTTSPHIQRSSTTSKMTPITSSGAPNANATGSSRIEARGVTESAESTSQKSKGEKGERGFQGYNGSDCDCLRLIRFAKPEKGSKGIKGKQGQKGDAGRIGPIGLSGTCSATQCARVPPLKGNKGEIGKTGYCDDSLCLRLITMSKGSKGDEGMAGSPGPRGDKGEKPELSTIVSSIIPDIKNSIEDLFVKTVKNLKGEPGSCACSNGPTNEYRKSQVQTIVLNDGAELRPMAQALPLGQMVFLIVENILLIKVDEGKNRWRIVKLDDAQSDWFVAPEADLNNPSRPSVSGMDTNSYNPYGRKMFDTSYKLMLIALPKQTAGDLRSVMYEPGSYSGSSYQCQKQAYNYGLGRAFYPLINTDTFDFTYMVPEKYRYTIPIVNRQNERIAQSFEDLMKMSVLIAAPVLDFEGNSIMSDISSPPCVWIGRKPSLYEYKPRTEEGLCLNWMSRRRNTTGTTTRLVIGRPLLDANYIKETPCKMSCFVLCMQIYPLISEITKN